MSSTDSLLAMVKDVLLFREHLANVRTQISGLSGDIIQLAQNHGTLAGRVARIEGFLEGAAAASRPRRLPRRTE